MNIYAALIAFFLDSAAKLWAEKALREGKTECVVPGKLYFTRVNNYGFINGVLRGQPALVKTVSVAAAALSLLFAHKELKDASFGARLGYSVMLGGGLSNMADRLKNGSVTDFIRFDERRGLVYNIADFFIFGGMAVFAVFSLLQKEGRS